MKYLRYNLLLVCLLSFSFQLLAQEWKTLRGTVKDAYGPLPGVNIVIMNENNRVLLGVITDGNGNFYLRVPEGEKLKVNFSFIGFKTHSIDYTGQETMNVTLQEDVKMLGEATILGSAQRNEMGVNIRNITGAVEKVTLERMEELPVTSLGDALQGKLANVDIVGGSGAPGAGSAIRIRGISTLSVSAEPLIVLNGVPFNTQIRDDFDFATASDEDLSGLVNLSPGDIESVEVLKDAAATAPYGSRGANGVLLITTKKGVQGRMTTTVTEKFSVNFEPERLRQLNGNQYVSLMQDELWNWGFDRYMDFDITQRLTQNGINFNPNFIYWKEYDQNTDWVKEISQTGLQNEVNVALSGGGERATYRFSVSHLTQTGTTVGTNYNRLNATLSLVYRFADNFRVETEMTYGQGDRDNTYYGNVRRVAMQKMPNMSPYMMEEDNKTRTNIYFSPNSTLQGSAGEKHYNPLAMVNEATNNEVNRNIRLGLNLNYNITRRFLYQGQFAFTVDTKDINKFLPQIVTGVYKDNALYNQSSTEESDQTRLYILNKLIYTRDFNGLLMTATGMVDLEVTSSASRSGANSGTASPGLPATGTGPIRAFSSSASTRRDVGMLLNLHFSYKERYLLGASFRYDATSVMDPTERWVGLPSVSLGWRMENESFMEQYRETVTGVKFRGSWGQTANRPSGTLAAAGRFTTEPSYGSMGAVGPSTMELTQLSYEIIDKWNAGVDVELYNGKYSATFDWYKNITNDLLQRSVPVPSHTGYSTVEWSNTGKLENSGWEIRLSVSDLNLTQNLRFDGNVNFSRNDNKILKLPDHVDYMQYPESIANRTYAITVSEGHPLGSFYGFKCLGVYSDQESVYVRDAAGAILTDVSGNNVHMRHEDREVRPGDASYKDINQDGVIDRYDIVYLGHAMPKFTGGFGLGLRYKGWRISGDFHFRLKYDVVNDTRMNLESMYNYDNQSVSVLNRWRYEGDVTAIPKAIYGRGYNTLGSDRFVEDATYLRMKSLTLTYNVPRAWLSRIGLSDCSFSVTGYDIFTWTRYSGQDPEVSIAGGMGSDGKFQLLGVDTALTPKPRRMAASLTVKF